jgi:murein DD-endopeptidase MepM/ murein hydrolase activator NlpD
LIVIIPKCSDDDADNTVESIIDTVAAVYPNEYGFYTDSLKEYKATVKRNETLSDLLNPHNVPLQEIYKIAKISKPLFNLTNIKFDQDYTLYFLNDSASTLRYFVYEIDVINFIVCDLTDSIRIYKERREVSTKIREVSGTIRYSLWQTLKESQVSELLAIKLSDVFAWQIDFYGIQKDDYFKVTFEEKFIGDRSIGVGKINSALFNHKHKDYYAFRFMQDDQDEFFDEEGNSLRKAFLKAPLKFSRISSGYTNNRYHPVLKYYRPHKGIDYAAPTGTPVQSIGDGTVTDVRWTTQGGRFVKIKHNSTYSSGYMHLSRYAAGLKPGKRVRQGEVIAYVGSSGLATGPHLDFRFWKNNQLVNYLRQEFPSSHPVKENDRIIFNALKDSMTIVLNQIQPADSVISITSTK